MDATVVLVMGIVMIAVGTGFLFMLLRGNSRYLPADAMEWAGSLLSVTLIFAAVILITMANPSPDISAVTIQAELPTIQDVVLEVPASNLIFTGVKDQQEHALEDYRGNVVIVNFWATWCVPCKAELPELNRLQSRYLDEGLVILSVSDETRDKLLAFDKVLPLRTTSLQMPAFTKLPPPFSGAFNTIPSTFIIDRDGMVRRYVLGARNYDFFERAIQPYI